MSLTEKTKEKMNSALDHLKEELKKIRTGHANPAMLDKIMVDAYGSKMKLRDLASITSPEPRQLVITPYDMSTKSAIGKAIEIANLGFMPIVDGNLVRINVPPMDDSMRKEMVKMCHKKREEAKVSLRNIRRDANELARKQKADGEIGEDILKSLEKNIQELTDKFCKQADDIAAHKEKEVSTI